MGILSVIYNIHIYIVYTNTCSRMNYAWNENQLRHHHTVVGIETCFASFRALLLLFIASASIVAAGWLRPETIRPDIISTAPNAFHHLLSSFFIFVDYNNCRSRTQLFGAEFESDRQGRPWRAVHVQRGERYREPHAYIFHDHFRSCGTIMLE